jgi:ferritin-like protein
LINASAENHVSQQEEDINRALAYRPHASTTDKLDEVLTELESFLCRFVIYPNVHSRVAHVLWIAHTHLMDIWDSTPRLAFLSPEPGSGKSRALEVTALFVPRPIESVNATSAYIFRKIGDPNGRPTLLYDEIDTVFGDKAKHSNEEIRGLLNAGHRKASTAGRCVLKGKEYSTEELPAYCAVALAGLGYLPDTILTRSIVIKMQRRAANEHVEPFRERIHKLEAVELNERLAQCMSMLQDQIGDPYPELPESIADRNADVWEGLIAIAECASMEWYEKACKAAVALVADSRDMKASISVQLLFDIHRFFEPDMLTTDDLIKKLLELDESPWADLHGKSIDPRGLSKLLKPFGIEPKTIRVGSSTPRGYLRQDFINSWNRYLPAS